MNRKKIILLVLKLLDFIGRLILLSSFVSTLFFVTFFVTFQAHNEVFKIFSYIYQTCSDIRSCHCCQTLEIQKGMLWNKLVISSFACE